MTVPALGPAAQRGADLWRKRRHRAVQLAERLPYARETLDLYQRLLAAQEPAHARALADRPPLAQLAEYVVRRVAPAVVVAVESAGIADLTAAGRPWLGEDAPRDVRGWLAGAELSPIGAFFARASVGPVLEALAGCGVLAVAANDPQHCPRCGGLPQLAFTAGGGDTLVTPPLQLCCTRCSQAWSWARLRCAACGEADTGRLVSFAAGEQLPQLRADACQSCRCYLVHVDMRRDHEAVPEVDELAALPLDLHAQEQGFRKVVSNLMGIG
jgi:FdhE protein